MFPSSLIGNFILGAVYASTPSKIGSVMDRADYVGESTAGKTIPSCGADVDSLPAERKVCLWSVKLSSIVEPFQDSMRKGKIVRVSSPLPGKVQRGAAKQWRLKENWRTSRESASQLVILLGSEEHPTLDQKERLNPKLINDLATKLDALILQEADSAGRVIYGPCLAIGVASQIRGLPYFQGDLISVCSDRSAPIVKISDLAIISSEINRLLETLLD